MTKPNLDKIKEIAGGTASFEQEMISIIKEELPAELEQYQFHLEQNNFKQTAESVHKLKHKISILGLEKSYELAVKYEHNLIENSKEGKEDFESILQNITDYLETI